MGKAQTSIDWRMDKEDVEYYSAMKKNEILPFAATWMELEGIMLSQRRQSEKDKYRMISLICGIQETQQRNIGEGEQK